MLERINADARSAVVVAQRVARTMGADSVNDAHLLVTLLQFASTVEALSGLQLTDYSVRNQMRLRETGLGEVDTAPFSARTKETIAVAVRTAAEREDDFVGVQHILLALLRDAPDPSHALLSAADTDVVRSRLERALGH